MEEVSPLPKEVEAALRAARRWGFIRWRTKYKTDACLVCSYCNMAMREKVDGGEYGRKSYIQIIYSDGLIHWHGKEAREAKRILWNWLRGQDGNEGGDGSRIRNFIKRYLWDGDR